MYPIKQKPPPTCRPVGTYLWSGGVISRALSTPFHKHQIVFGARRSNAMPERAGTEGIQNNRPPQADNRIQSEEPLPEPPINFESILRFRAPNLRSKYSRPLLILLLLLAGTVIGGFSNYLHAWSGISLSKSVGVDQLGRKVPLYDIRGSMFPAPEYIVSWHLFGATIEGGLLGSAVAVGSVFAYLLWREACVVFQARRLD